MSPASEMPTGEGDGGRSVPNRPFISGREAGHVPAHTSGSSFPRPFRTGGGPGKGTSAVHHEGDSDRSEWTDAVDGLPEAGTRQVAQTEPSAESGNEPLPLDAGQEAELAPEADFPPLVSWDPLADVGWRAAPAGSEPQAATETPALMRTGDLPAAERDGDFTGLSTGSVEAPVEGIRSGTDELASKLEALAAAIRRDKVEELLAEDPEDALTALVAGYYIGTLRQKGATAG